MKKFIVLTLLILGTLQSYAQFSYSIKAGWSWPNIHNETLPGHKVQSAFTLGAAVDYQLNAYLGLQSGWKEGRYETFYGIMAAAQLEICSHYFIRGEYQWALKSDYDGIDERRTNMFSVSLGYRLKKKKNK